MTAVAAQWLAGLLGIGGAGALVSGRADLQRRWVTWIVLSVALVVAFSLPPHGPAVLACACAVAGAAEYGRTALGVRAGRRAAFSALGLAWLAPFAGFVLLGDAALPLALAALLADVAARGVGTLLGGSVTSWPAVTASAAAGTVALVALGQLSWPFALAVLAGPPLGAVVRRVAGVRVGLLAKASPLLGTFGLALALSGSTFG